MYPKIININATDDYSLIVNFDNGVRKKYDFKRNFQNPVFQELKDKALFNQVKVDTGGYGISWNDDVDLSEYELWENGTLIDEPVLY
ncbi:MAG: DUF2442 domain-containing protein [bacterium]|nr:DUF2442 domain-containing protein [bacterium]